ncbi:MAG: hypothetical protein M3153_00020 [Chloroflexota bacterium]|nr:hypothetical protein [Chloroflexota bacterium]
MQRPAGGPGRGDEPELPGDLGIELVGDERLPDDGKDEDEDEVKAALGQLGWPSPDQGLRRRHDGEASGIGQTAD